MKRNTKRRTKRETARELPPLHEVAARVDAHSQWLSPPCSQDAIGCPESPRGLNNGRRRTTLSTSRSSTRRTAVGCHGAQGEISGAIALDNPMYLAVVPRETLRTIIATGVAGTAMIGFSEEHGGLPHRKADRHPCGRHQRLGEESTLRSIAGLQWSPRKRRPGRKPLSRPIARVAMALTEMARKPAPSSIPPMWASLVINICAPSLSPDAMISGAPIFRAAYLASRCRKRKFPALSPGWCPREGMNSDNHSP